jgi:hypothetical protein
VEERERAPRRTRGEGDDVTASEAAGYVFCAKAWHLEHVLGLRPSTAAAERRATGTVAHDTHGTRVGELQRVGPRLVRGVGVLLVATVVLAALAVISLVTGR